MLLIWTEFKIQLALQYYHSIWKKACLFLQWSESWIQKKSIGSRFQHLKKFNSNTFLILCQIKNISVTLLDCLYSNTKNWMLFWIESWNSIRMKIFFQWLIRTLLILKSECIEISYTSNIVSNFWLLSSIL